MKYELWTFGQYQYSMEHETWAYAGQYKLLILHKMIHLLMEITYSKEGGGSKLPLTFVGANKAVGRYTYKTRHHFKLQTSNPIMSYMLQVCTYIETLVPA